MSSPQSPVQLLVSWIALLGICSYFVSTLRKKSTQENWWGYGKFVPKVDSLIDNGRWSNPQNNQSQLPYPNQSSTSSSIYQVPGYAQSSLSPRIMGGGIADKVQYNLPSLPHMGLEPFNPMSLANGIQCPPSSSSPSQHHIKENFDYTQEGRASTSYNAQQSYQNLQNHSLNKAANRLPIPSMLSNNQEAGETPVVNYDRFIVANLSRQRGPSDYIRGDLFITPVLPDNNTNSLIMFRPSNGTESLNTGAMAVLTGAYNETNALTSNLSMAGNSGVQNTFSGIAWARPQTTSVGQQIANNAMASQKATGSTTFGDVASSVEMSMTV